MKITDWWKLFKLYNKLKGGINMNVLNDRKTYICAAVIGLANAAHYLGYIDADLLKMIIGLFGAGGLAALRAGVKKSGQ